MSPSTFPTPGSYHSKGFLQGKSYEFKIRNLFTVGTVIQVYIKTKLFLHHYVPNLPIREFEMKLQSFRLESRTICLQSQTLFSRLFTTFCFFTNEATSLVSRGCVRGRDGSPLGTSFVTIVFSTTIEPPTQKKRTLFSPKIGKYYL